MATVTPILPTPEAAPSRQVTIPEGVENTSYIPA